MNNGRDLSQSAREEAQSADADLVGPPARREAPARVVFRRPVRWIVAGLFGVGTVMFLSGVIATAGPARLASGAAATAACFLMVRAARASIVAEPGRLLVRNVYWTHKVGWLSARSTEPNQEPTATGSRPHPAAPSQHRRS